MEGAGRLLRDRMLYTYPVRTFQNAAGVPSCDQTNSFFHIRPIGLAALSAGFVAIVACATARPGSTGAYQRGDSGAIVRARADSLRYPSVKADVDFTRKKFIRARSSVRRGYGVIADLASAARRVAALSSVRSAPLARLVGGADGGPRGGRCRRAPI